MTTTTATTAAPPVDLLLERVRAGREFGPDDVEQKRNVAIVSETFARRFLPGEQMVGRRFLIDDELWEIVGLAKDVRQTDLKTPPDAIIYRPRVEPMVSIGNRRMAGAVSLLVRVNGDIGPRMAAVRSTLDAMSGR